MSKANVNDRLVLTDGSVDPDGSVLHITAPFIVGLLGAVLGMAVIVPDMLRHAQLVVIALLVPAMIVSVGIYVWSVLNPGDVAGVIAHPAARRLEIVRSNPFASRRTEIEFDDIARISVASAYDPDGYPRNAVNLTLRDGEQMPIGFGLDEGQVATLRRLIGLED